MSRLLESLPPVEHFCTIDHLKAFSALLVAENQGRVERRDLGRSRQGETIFELRLGKGEKHALLLGLPHPDEPIGAHALMHLCPMLLEEDRGYTWHIVPFCDPDGTRLNEGWYGQPLNPLTMAQHYYRPAEIDQFEWTFPIEHKRLHFNTPNPEAQAVLGLMQSVPFHFMMNMHNCTYGGAYLYFSHAAPALADAIYPLLAEAGIAPHKGTPEVPYLVPLDDRATFKVYGTREVYDYYEQHGVAEPERMISAGTCADETAIEKWNTFTFVCELPYFTHPDIGNTEPTDVKLSDVIGQGARQRQEDLKSLSDLYDGLRPFMTKENPFRHKLDYDLGIRDDDVQAEIQQAQAPEFQRPATRAEVVDALGLRRYKFLNLTSHLCRGVTWELERGHTVPALIGASRPLVTARQQLATQMQGYCPVMPVPRETLVRVMGNACLLAADWAASNHNV